MSAPSFSSFPPSFSSFPDLEAGPSTSTSAQSTEKSKDKREKKSKDKSKDKKRSRHRHKDDPHHYDVDDRKNSSPSTVNESSRIYYSDKKGDPYNVQYGGLHAGDIARYHIVDRGRRILGLSSAWMVTHRGGKGVEVGPTGRRKLRTLTDSTARALLLAPPTRSLLPCGDTYKHHEEDGFLRLPSRRSHAINVESYRSITASRDHNASSDSDALDASEQASSDESSSDEITLTSHQEKTKLIEKELSVEPTSVEKWLQLLSHALSEVALLSKDATRVRSEITVSILGRAFSVDARNKTSTILCIRYLKAGEEVWERGQAKEEWEKALTTGEVDIWMEWLEWRIREAIDGVDGIVEDAVRILGVLGKQDELAKVRVFWRIAVLLQRAGFMERATAMFQAQAELAFNAPKIYQCLPHESQIEHLEDFWESETPRVGEAESRGWSGWASNNEGQIVHSNKSVTAPPVVELDPYRQWASFELRMDGENFMPSRSYDDVDDPYSTILFSDIRPLLVSLTSALAKDAFRRAWLSFAGLHIPGFSLTHATCNEIDWDDRWSLGHLTRASYLDALLPSNETQTRLTNEAFAGVIVGREKQYADVHCPVKSWGHGVLGPLDTIGVSDKGKAKAAMWGREDVEGVDHSFIRHLFSQLRLGADDADWDVLRLAFEAAINIKAATKLSRTMLSQNESLAHWAAHAQLEQIRERIDDARKIYQTVPTASRVRGTSDLWWNWARMEWLEGNIPGALQVVLRSVGVEGQGGVTVLRCKRGLDDAIKEERDWKSREGWIKLRSLLEILTVHDIMGAVRVFDDHLFGERKKGPRRESLLVACLLTIYQYGVVLKNAMPPAVLRQRVEKAMEEYPTNSIILGLFLEGERGQGVWGRVRGMLGESGGKMKDVVRRVEEVWIGAWAQRGGEVERARNSLAIAVESERTRGSYILWRIYIELEIRTGRLVQAKKLLFRAMGECPLVKGLYLMAFGPLRSVFSGQELVGIEDTMAERGLRLRRGLDEGLDGWKDEVEGGEESESGDETIFEKAGELRRLMPY